MNEKNPAWQQVEPLRKFQDTGKRRRVRTEGGKTRMVPALPFEYWCKPSGSLVRLAVMTTRNVAQAVDPTRYMDYAHRRAIREGWFPWEYALMKKLMPDAGADCASEADWDKKRHALQKQRMQKHKERTRQTEARWLDQSEQRKLESKEAFAEAIKEFTAELKSIDGKR